MVTVQICSTLPEAQVVQSHLRGSGIEAFLPDEMTVQNNWMWTNAIGGVRVQVVEEDAEKAVDILRDNTTRKVTNSCPRCGAELEELHGFDLYAKIALAILFSIPIRSKASWKCPQCDGHGPPQQLK